jgi:hypothetical protein
MERMWQERADYGHFFYRIPNGESAADAYDRISGFNESLWRQFGEDDCASVCILGKLLKIRHMYLFADSFLVTHGLMSRVFLMKWYHFSVEYFEDLRNVNHCEFLIMRKKEDSGKYILENKLRTWSELRREREAEKKEKDKSAPAAETAESSQSSLPKRKQWGGCPNGCEHRRYHSMKTKFINGIQLTGKEAHLVDGPVRARPRMRRWQSSDEDEDDPRGHSVPPEASTPDNPDEIVSSPDGTPSFISVEDRLHGRAKSPNLIPLLRVGRDFGGSASGNTSRGGSDSDEDVRNVARKSNGRVTNLRKAIESIHKSGMGRGAKADALGDQSGSDGEADDDVDPLEKEEVADKSIKGSIY